MDVNPVIIRWLYGLLTERQRLVMRSSSTLEVSSEVRTTTGAPQGCVLSPALFILCTWDCRCTDKGTLHVKSSEDVTMSENAFHCVVGKPVG